MKTWIYNNARRRERAFGKLFTTKKYTYRHVACHNMKDEIQEVVERLSGALPGTAEYFSKYQEGLKEFCDNLSKDCIEDYRLIAETWNKRKPAARVQQLSVHTAPLISPIADLVVQGGRKTWSAIYEGICSEYGATARHEGPDSVGTSGH